VATKRSSRRSTLPKDEARRQYVEIGELAALKQIRKDSRQLDRRSIAVGPFARLDANAVAAQEGKTRGAITNLFGSQERFRVETMELALNAQQEIERLEYPAPRDFATAEAWVDALFSHEAARGPRHGAEPAADHAFLWALWLSAAPYGIWSKRISQLSMEEYRHWVARLEQVLGEALDVFDLALRDGTTLTDLASAAASLIEGAWLNQCLTTRNPADASQPIDTLLRRSGRLLWNGATVPRARPA
jgi:hypothetical protein